MMVLLFQRNETIQELRTCPVFYNKRMIVVMKLLNLAGEKPARSVDS
jgi:hypothetical protein